MSKASVTPIRPEKKYQPFAPGAARFDVVQARRFELVDAAGQIRGGLGFTDDGDPMLLLCDGPKLTMRAKLTLDQKKGAMLQLGDRKGRPQITLAVGNDSPVTGIVIADARQAPRLLLGINENNVVVTGLYDSTGRQIEVLKRFKRKSPGATPPPLTALAKAGKKREFIEAMAAAIDGYDWGVGEAVYNGARARVAKNKATRRGGKV
jgi:hypothetical protein